MDRSQLLHQPIILLKAGTEQSSGKHLILSNIKSCCEVGEIVSSTLGPMGADKLIKVNDKTHITNDGATIMELLDIVHPAVKLLVDISKSQDKNVGDGTTSVILIATEIMKVLAPFIADEIRPRYVLEALNISMKKALEQLDKVSTSLENLSETERMMMIRKAAEVSLNSKILCENKYFFSEIAYKAVKNMLEGNNNVVDINLIDIKKVVGGSITDTMFISGVAFPKCFSYAGFERAPKQFDNGCKIIALNMELELKAERENSMIRIDDVNMYQKVIDAEWKILINRLQTICDSGVNVVISSQSIGDIATQYLADRDVFCAGRVEKSDFERIAKASGAIPLMTVSKINTSSIGYCGKFEEVQIGKERFNVFNNCREAVISTIIIRGGNQQFVDEAERSLHDSIMISARLFQTKQIVPGAGAIEMSVATALRKEALNYTNKIQLIIEQIAKAFEVIPRTLAKNSNLDPTSAVLQLRALHEADPVKNANYGVNCRGTNSDCVLQAIQTFVWEPLLLKSTAYKAAKDAASTILNMDYMIKNPKSNPDPKN